MTVTYMTDDEWAQIKNYIQFGTHISGNGYVDDNDTPTAEGLDLKRRMAFAEINRAIPGTLTKGGFEDDLLQLEFKVVELMRSEELMTLNPQNQAPSVPQGHLTPGELGFLSGLGSKSIRRSVS